MRELTEEELKLFERRGAQISEAIGAGSGVLTHHPIARLNDKRLAAPDVILHARLSPRLRVLMQAKATGEARCFWSPAPRGRLTEQETRAYVAARTSLYEGLSVPLILVDDALSETPTATSVKPGAKPEGRPH